MDETTNTNRNRLAPSHTPEQVRRRLEAPIVHNYLRDFVYGAIDGTVTTFAVVSGAGLSDGVIIVLGLANLVGDGFSMAAGNYLATETEKELRDKARKTEAFHITHYPEGEREEVRQIFAAKGFEGDQLEKVVEVITADRNRWIDTMIVEELGLSLNGPSALRAAMTTLLAFIVVGLIPLVAFLYNHVATVDLESPYWASTVLTGVAFVAVGAAKSWFVDESWYRAGAETLLIGSGAAGLAYAV